MVRGPKGWVTGAGMLAAVDIIGKLMWLILTLRRSLLFNRRSFKIFLRSP
jgi:hypothetical protein